MPAHVRFASYVVVVAAEIALFIQVCWRCLRLPSLLLAVIFMAK